MKTEGRLRPVNVPSPQSKPGDPRVGALVSSVLAADTAVALIGFPTDAGVTRNGGRAGAAQAPDKIRSALFKFTPDAETPRASEALWRRVADLGDIAVTGDLAVDQAVLGDVVADLLARSVVPIILGGGHETAFGHFLGYAVADRKVGIINVDAHLDVRELVDGKGHSGSPFREARDHPSQACLSYEVLGVAPHACAAAHLEYVRSRGGECLFRAGVTVNAIDRIVGGADRPTLLTLDLDAVDAAFSPGVSAPCVGGLSPDLWLHAAWAGGKNRNVQSFDIVEYNPTYDIDDRTARLAALTVWYIVKGLGERFVDVTKPRLGFRS
jgi:formiminoglutamase